MLHYMICTACGTQYPQGIAAGAHCPVCADERQYIPETGQGWTTLEALQNNYGVIINKLQDNLYELKMAPSFAIGQRALLVITPGGNILWDCIALINEPTIAFIRSMGGLEAIAFSHPHYYTTMNEWAGTFDCPVYIHAHDEEWIYNKGSNISLWHATEMELWNGIKLVNVGGHFKGSSILHVPFLSGGGAILCGDTFYISPSKQYMAAMYSYPNRIPLPVKEIRRIKTQMMAIPFDTMFGFYDFQNICGNAKHILETSLERYT